MALNAAILHGVNTCTNSASESFQKASILNRSIEAFVRFWVAKKHKIGYNDNYEILCNFAETFFGIEGERTQACKINYKLGRFESLHIRK